MTPQTFRDALTAELDGFDPEYVATRLQHSALTFEGDRVTLKDTTGFTISGTQEQVLANYAAHVRRSKPEPQEGEASAQQTATDSYDPVAAGKAMAEKQKTARDLTNSLAFK